MAVNFEVKGMLARLLATEDIIVEHKKVDTACFDVETRVLTLPMWERASNSIYDLLLSHEAAHALYTPNEDWTSTHQIPPQFVNVVEDVRIEKLVKRRYAGLSRTFYNGYKELFTNNFFELEGEDIDKFNLADRANLYFKIGSHLQIAFTEEEQEILDLIMECETFQDTLNAAEILFKYCKDDYTPPPQMMIQIQMGGESGSSNGIPIQIPASPMQSNGNSDQSIPQSANCDNVDDIDATPRPGGSGDSFDANKSSSSQNSDQSQGSGNEDKNSKNENGSEQGQNPELQSASTHDAPGSQNGSSLNVKTQESLDKSLNNLIFNGGPDNVYLEIPDININEIIVPNVDIHKRCSDFWNQYTPETFTEPDAAYKKFKTDAQKEVNFLVKEFESRKSADAYVRSSISKTGVLDCKKLHTYKNTDDIFKRITTVPDGKNHGLIFILDWSGSMDIIMEDTIKQLYNLIWFCRKVSIPFEVYAFTTAYPHVRYHNGKIVSKRAAYTEKVGCIHVTDSFSLMQIFTSKVNAHTLDVQMRDIHRITYTMYPLHRRINYQIPHGLGLSGTPLNEALICLHKIIPQFQQEYKLQKVQCVVLTDGDGCPLKYHEKMKDFYTKKDIIGHTNVCSNAILRNRKTGNTYKFSADWFHQTTVFLRNLRDMYKDTNFIGIRILGNDATHFVRRFSPEHNEFKKIMESWKKHKTCNVKDISGYHSYFGISGSTLSNNSNFEVKDSASKSQIKSAFIKSLKTKKMNKKILTEFIDLVV